MNRADLEQLVARVIDFSVKNVSERDCWEKASCMQGILMWGNEDSQAVVQRWMERSIETQTSMGILNYDDASTQSAALGFPTIKLTATLSTALGAPLLDLYEKHKNPKYLEAAGRQMQALINGPRTADGGLCPAYIASGLMIDYTQLMCPFLIRYGQITHEEKYIDEAFTQFKVHVKHLLDPLTNLPRHMWIERPNSYPQSTFWARGAGWLLMAGIEILELAADHPKANVVKDVVKRVIAGVAPYQDRCGYLRNTLDDPQSNFEASSTLMYATAIARAIALNMELTDKERIEDAKRAFQVVANSVDPSGMVPGVSVPPGGPTVPFGWTMFGQGFFLLAAEALKYKFE